VCVVFEKYGPVVLRMEVLLNNEPIVYWVNHNLCYLFTAECHQSLVAHSSDCFASIRNVQESNDMIFKFSFWLLIP
jgi:hypothetical protein